MRRLDWKLAVPAFGLIALQATAADASSYSYSSTITEATAAAVATSTQVLNNTVNTVTSAIASRVGGSIAVPTVGAAPQKAALAPISNPRSLAEGAPLRDMMAPLAKEATAVGFDLGDGGSVTTAPAAGTAPRGASGAAAAPKFGAFGGALYSHLKDNNAATRSRTDVYTGLGGADYDLGGGLTVGGAVALSYAEADLTAQSGESEITTFLVAPFVGYRLTDNIGLVGTVGYGHSNIESNVLSTTTPTSTETDARTYFIRAGAVAGFQSGAFTYGGNADIMWSKTFVDGTTDSRGNSSEDSSSRIGQLIISGKAGYLLTVDRATSTYVEPYAKLGLEYDWAKTKIAGQETDRSGLVIGGGANLYSGSGMSVSSEVTYTDRDKQGLWQGGVTVRVPF